MQQHHVDDTTSRKSDQGKGWPPNTQGAREAEDDIQQQTHAPENNTQGLVEQMHSSNEATQRYPHRQASHQNTNSLRDMGDNTTHKVFEGGPAVKLLTKNIQVGTIANGNPRQDQNHHAWIGFTVLDLLTTHSLSFVRIQYHAPVTTPLLNPSQVPVKGGNSNRSICLLANNCH